ncbi:MAG: hypothetical protein NTV24_02740 [Candidatus Woesebacteria bacterium]|nr:hypothetical protein [Candidatus Woesebacteria bacterium]
MKGRKTITFLVLIFVFAFVVRFLSVWPSNTIIGFDQARDLFDSAKILQGDLRVVGPTAGNNPNLHHGVLWLYFMTVPLLFSHNPIYVVLWNSLFNAFSAVVIYLLAKDLFKSKKVGIIAGVITAVSYYYVSFSGWLSNPTITLLTVPLFFFGVWKYYRGKTWGLPLSMLALGLSIQFELFFIYLIPVFFILVLVLRLKFPSFKVFIYSLSAIICTLSTMLATEIKFHFAGVISLLSAGKLVGGVNQNYDYAKFLSLDLLQNKNLDLVLGILAISFLVFEIVRNPLIRKRNLFLLVWFFSPTIMLLLGTHNAPWFLIGKPAAAIIITAYLISKLKFKFLIISAIIFFVYMNLSAVKSSYGLGQPLLEPDKAAILSKQIEVMKYTYEKSGWGTPPTGGQAFAIDTVTNPLYINAVWAWNFDWYGKKLGYKPTWLGGDQLPPYNTLNKATGKEKYMFLIIDETSRIPPVYTQNAIKNISKSGKLLEEKSFDGISVMTWFGN